jgi:magnesium transporter
MPSTILHYTPDGAVDETSDGVAACLAGDGALWVDMTRPSEAELQWLRSAFGLHPLAIEDARSRRQRPKIEVYDNHLFCILNMAESRSAGAFHELDVFLGANYVVTVHGGREAAIEEARARIGRRPGNIPVSAGFIFYAIVDAVVDGYFPILDRMLERIQRVEEEILLSPAKATLSQLFHMKREALGFSRVVGPQRDMFNVLTRRDLPYIDHDALQYYLRDVYDHLIRVTDIVAGCREQLTSAADLYASVSSNRLAQVVNRLTLVTIAVGIIAAVSGFYGMNFEHTWPPFDAPWGILIAILVMGGLLFGVFSFFNRRGWLG